MPHYHQRSTRQSLMPCHSSRQRSTNQSPRPCPHQRSMRQSPMPSWSSHWRSTTPSPMLPFHSGSMRWSLIPHQSSALRSVRRSPVPHVHVCAWVHDHANAWAYAWIQTNVTVLSIMPLALPNSLWAPSLKFGAARVRILQGGSVAPLPRSSAGLNIPESAPHSQWWTPFPNSSCTDHVLLMTHTGYEFILAISFVVKSLSFVYLLVLHFLPHCSAQFILCSSALVIVYVLILWKK